MVGEIDVPDLRAAMNVRLAPVSKFLSYPKP